MKITRISAQNYLGIRAADIALDRPVQLFAGRNGAGKSSLQEAVRHALTGETVRVSLKKEYALLLTEGAESGFVEVVADGGAYAVALPSGKGTCFEAGAINYVLDAQRFASLSPDERRAFLFGLMGLSSSGDAVKKRLADKGFDDARVALVMPLLRAGFDAACKEAQNRARDAKSAWKTVTGGETWGKDKAAGWRPPALPEGAAKAPTLLENARAKLTEADAALATAQQALGAARSAAQAREEQEQQRAQLEERAGRIERIRTKLAKDESELADWQPKVADAKAAAGGVKKVRAVMEDAVLRGLAKVAAEFLGIAEASTGIVATDSGEIVEWDEGLINRARAHVAEYRAQSKTAPAEDAQAAAKLAEYEKARDLMQSAVANSRRDLAAAEAAEAQLVELDKAAAGDTPNFDELREDVQQKIEARDAWRADVAKYQALAEQAARQEKVIEQAAQHHADVQAWLEIADALSPDGIPGEMLAEALGPINSRLGASAVAAGWSVPQIVSGMKIKADGRPYALLSESEKWRADAMIAEAVSHLSGLRLLVLDRFDVLDLAGRADALEWLDQLAAEEEIDTALVFGTLKALPCGLPETIQAHWIDGGVVGQMREAA
ncbi:MAG: AAA family ATPase [Gammaproteobacteria bacterium]|nr:AAA family ATPase [Gammaproteobacteria bacterium]MBU0771757.1 AAA family ATPase [Gammaproteobacteria bacterium]MBU0855513.1 AAA family ATPase [Gammaproteobacteria bacterium]MBU1846075.1 AAA family ATPase [Gammaproteobacteria bacterium]